jgi:hypothetical protein
MAEQARMVSTGDLYRIPKEALVAGCSPVIRKESAGASRLVRLSANPFITTLQARTRPGPLAVHPAGAGPGGDARLLTGPSRGPHVAALHRQRRRYEPWVRG